jgi:predicted  nucleic acid-binding Zn-ribbon protein
MKELACVRCGQRYFGAAASLAAPCEFCGSRLDEARHRHGGRSDSAPLPAVRPPLPEAAAGSFELSATSYQSIIAFIRDDDRRMRSREHDIGLCWRESSTGHTFRAAWVEDTGELFVVQTGAPGEGGGHVEVLAAGCDEQVLNRVLPGWREFLWPMGSLDWLRRTLRQAGSGPPLRVV